MNIEAVLAAYHLTDQERLATATAELNSPEVLQAALWLLRILAERGVDVVALLELLSKNLSTGEVDQGEIARLLEGM